MKTRSTIRREQAITGTIAKADLVELIMGVVEVPFGVEPRIFVKVPSGGDYSGAELDIGEDIQLEFVIRWDDNAEEQG